MIETVLINHPDADPTGAGEHSISIVAAASEVRSLTLRALAYASFPSVPSV
jgi:hypothetical protein